MLKPYTNNTGKTQTIGTRRLEPGQTRMVEDTMIPGYRAAQPPKAPPVDDIAELIQGSIKDFTASIEALNDDELQRARKLENSGKKRKGVLTAIDEALLDRAASEADDA